MLPQVATEAIKAGAPVLIETKVGDAFILSLAVFAMAAVVAFVLFQKRYR